MILPSGDLGSTRWPQAVRLMAVTNANARRKVALMTLLCVGLHELVKRAIEWE